MAESRQGEVTFKGNPVELAGPRLAPGQKAPDFEVVGEGLNLVHLADTAGKARIFSVVPSVDTPVCDKQTRRFAEAIGALGDQVACYTISLDMPFALKRFCAAAGIGNMTTLSDVHDGSFGERYGVLIKSLPIPLLARAIFVVGPDDTIRHVEYVKEIATEPDYDAALSAVQAASGA